MALAGDGNNGGDDSSACGGVLVVGTGDGSNGGNSGCSVFLW